MGEEGVRKGGRVGREGREGDNRERKEGGRKGGRKDRGREVQYAPKNPSRCSLMKRNGTGRLMKRNRPFTIRSSSVRGPCIFAVRFESVLIKYYYIRIAQSVLARGSL